MNEQVQNIASNRIQIKIMLMHYLASAVIMLPFNYSNVGYFGMGAIRSAKMIIFLVLLGLLVHSHASQVDPSPALSSPIRSNPSKMFTCSFTQSTTSASKILTLSQSSISIYNPSTQQVGIIKFNTASTPTMITLNPNNSTPISSYIHGNFIYNRYSAQGYSPRQMYTLVGQQFYDGYAGTWSGMPKLWIVTQKQYVVKLDSSGVLWVSHWKNVRYLRVCSTAVLNVSVTAILSQVRNRIYLVTEGNQIVLLCYNQTIQNYTIYSPIIYPSDPNLNLTSSTLTLLQSTLSSSSSSSSSYFYHHQRISPSQLSIFKNQAYINTSFNNLQFQPIANYTIDSFVDITKIAYCENLDNFIVLLSNGSLRICAFSWPECYHLRGVPVSQVTAAMESGDYLASQFQLRNLTHFVVMTLSSKLQIYSTLEFSPPLYLSAIQWPQGTDQSEPLTAPVTIIQNQSNPTYKYDQPDTSQLQSQFTDLSTSTIVLVYLVSIPQARNMLTFMNPLYLLLDNFWFYNYQQMEFGPVINRTFTILRLMNQIKLFPLPFYSFENTVKQQINLDSVTRSNFTLISPNKFVGIQNNDVNFLKNVQDILLWNSLYQILGYFVLKFLLKLPILKPGLIRTFILRRCHCGLLIISIIQCNVQFYAFMGLTQMRMLGSMEFGDKIKNLMTVVVVFIVFVYSTAAFMVMKALFSNFWSVLIQDSKYGRRSIFFTTIWLALQNLVTGMANGLFQEDIGYLKWIIISIDVSSIICLIFFWTTAKSYISNLMTFLYLAFKLTFDVVVYTQNYQHWVESLLIGGIVTTVFYSIFWNMFITYRETVTHFQVNKGEKIFQTVIQTDRNCKTKTGTQVTEQRPKEYVQYDGEVEFERVGAMHSVQEISLAIIQDKKGKNIDNLQREVNKNKRKTIIKSSENFNKEQNILQFFSNKNKIIASGVNFMSKFINFVDEKQNKSQNLLSKTNKIKQQYHTKIKQKHGKKIKFKVQNQCTSGVISQNNEITLHKPIKHIKQQQNDNNKQKSIKNIIFNNKMTVNLQQMTQNEQKKIQ